MIRSLQIFNVIQLSSVQLSWLCSQVIICFLHKTCKCSTKVGAFCPARGSVALPIRSYGWNTATPLTSFAPGISRAGHQYMNMHPLTPINALYTLRPWFINFLYYEFAKFSPVDFEHRIKVFLHTKNFFPI